MTLPSHSVKHVRNKYRKFQILAALFAILTIAATFLVAVSGIQMTLLKKKQMQSTADTQTEDLNKQNELNQQIDALKAQLAKEQKWSNSLNLKVKDLEKRLAAIHKAIAPTAITPPLEGHPKPVPPPTPKPKPSPVKATPPAQNPKPVSAPAPQTKPAAKPQPAPSPKMPQKSPPATKPAETPKAAPAPTAPSQPKASAPAETATPAKPETPTAPSQPAVQDNKTVPAPPAEPLVTEEIPQDETKAPQ